MESEGEWEDLGCTCPAAVTPLASTANSSSKVQSDDDASSLSEEDDECWTASEIVPGVWVGRKEDAELPEALSEHAIGLVISVHNEDQVPPVSKTLSDSDSDGIRVQGVEWCRLHIEDRPDSDLLRHFDTVSDKIAAFKRVATSDAENVKPASVLVHCLAGQSRSVAIVAAFLMREHGCSLRSLIDWDEATQTHGNGLIQRARRGAFPNRGLWRQLVAYESACLGEASYSEDQLPGSIYFEKAAIEAVISRYLRRRSATAAPHGSSLTGASKRKDAAESVDAAARAGKRQRQCSIGN